METQIEFTDRYGGRSPSWLRACHGQCEAMGVYPVHVDAHAKLGEMSEEEFRKSLVSPVGDLTRYERAEVDRLVIAHGIAEDGWYFIRCQECRGTGRVSWLTTLARVPLWIPRAVSHVWQFRPGSAYWTGHPFGWWRRAWVALKAGALCDLGVRM